MVQEVVLRQGRQGSSTFCDVGYIPEKRVSWIDRPEFAGQVEDLMKLIDWSRLDGLRVVGNFIFRRVMPLGVRVRWEPGPDLDES